MALADWAPHALRQLAALFHRLVDDFVTQAGTPVEGGPSGA
ncbi:hypothetical protein ACFWBB_15990 [Streptomyces sp. NPDC060000]